MGIWSTIRKAAKKAAKAVKKAAETAVGAVAGSSVGGVIASVVAPAFGLDFGTAIVIGVVVGGIVGGAAGASGGFVEGLRAGAGFFGWTLNRLTQLVRKGGPLATFLSPFICPNAVASFLSVEALNKWRAYPISGQQLHSNTKAVMKAIFPQLDLDAVRVHSGVDVFPSWASAITFRNTIFMRGFVRCDYLDNEILLHELVHVRQYQQMSFWVFACRYAHEVLRGGSLEERWRLGVGIEEKTLEDEAYEFQAQNAWTLRNELQRYCAHVSYLAGHQRARHDQRIAYEKEVSLADKVASV
ncbi:MAG: DUF4157 domain-containing protein [Bacteroidetes bacterium]|nr:DUF4157 domain-containing protein [Bacteroidota bacterium]